MTVINEMVSEIRFIKYLAYEDQWIKRVLDARATELKVILQSTSHYLPTRGCRHRAADDYSNPQVDI